MSFDIKDIISRISKLTQKEKVHILNILYTKKIEYTKNANGYFFNFLDIDDDVVKKIHDCLVLIEQNTDLIKEMERRRDELLKYYKLLIEDRIQTNLQQKKDNYIKRLFLKDYTDIKLIKKRKIMINRKHINPNIDPDILIKEHLKSKFKYPKNSVYHKLLTSIKLSKSNKIKNKNDDDNDMSSDIKSNYDIDNFTDEGDVEIDDENIEYELSENDNDNDHDNYSETDVLDKETAQIEDLVIETESVEEGYIDENEAIEETEVEDADYKKMEFLYFKKLLNEQGFVFDENKGCLLVVEDYLE